ncbi:MAG: methyltransferase domain-containing protein [Halanaeroarchaeum sp.]
MSASIPDTVTDALGDVPVEGARALEAGAGVGNGTAGLLAAGAETVYSVTDEPDHARTVRDRCPSATVLEADLGAVPLPDDTVDVVLAHGLFNVLPNETATAVAAELTRVAAPGGWLVVDDYDPHPPDSRIRQLIAVENALAELATSRPAYVFYPAGELRTLFEGHGWAHERTATLLQPVPWTTEHLRAHRDAARRVATSLPNEVADPLLRRATQLAENGDILTGRMYSLAFRNEA